MGRPTTIDCRSLSLIHHKRNQGGYDHEGEDKEHWEWRSTQPTRQVKNESRVSKLEGGVVTGNGGAAKQAAEALCFFWFLCQSAIRVTAS